MELNYFDKMKKDILEKGQSFSGRIGNTGWKYIPSVKTFDIIPGEVNEMLRKVGLKRKLPKKVLWKTHKSTQSMNDYMKYQVSRLERFRNRGDWKSYWKVCIHLFRNSTAFRTSAFSRIYPSWYRTMPLGTVIGLNKGIEKIIKSWDCNLKYHRVYIPKSSGEEFRPLGVPSEAWRVVMHMWNNFLTQAFKPSLEKFNHGFLPGKGTGTAWQEVIKRVLDSKFIYEFDLKQFFPSTSHAYVLEMLERFKVPPRVIAWLGAINETMPTFPKEEKLDESLVKDSVSKDYAILKELGELALETMKLDGYTDLWEYAKSETFKKHVLGNLPEATSAGLPQGLNTSPILSILTLLDWYHMLRDRGIQLIMYADDGIMFSNENFEPYFPPSLIPNLEKSKWVRKWGIGPPTMKFLGLTYNWKTDKLSGSTRKGSTLEFSPSQDDLVPLIRTLREVFYQRPGNWMKYVAESGVMGLVQSKLYCGSWSELNQQDKGWRIHPQSWWGIKSQQKMKGHRTLSSTASMTLINIVWGTMHRQRARFFKKSIYDSRYLTF